VNPRTIFLTPLRETPEARKQRLESVNKHKADRSNRADRRKGASVDEVERANVYRELGFDYYQGATRKQISHNLEGVRLNTLSANALQFLSENFSIGQVERRGRIVLHFKSKKEKHKMNLLKAVAEKTEVQKKTVREVYEGIVSVIDEQLKAERRCRLPQIGVIMIRFKDSQKGGVKKPNPFKPGTFYKTKARKASNKLRINPAKDLKKFVEKLPVVAPKKHKK
jgi:nucleoid DNA-binding protein